MGFKLRLKKHLNLSDHAIATGAGNFAQVMKIMQNAHWLCLRAPLPLATAPVMKKQKAISMLAWDLDEARQKAYLKAIADAESSGVQRPLLQIKLNDLA